MKPSRRRRSRPAVLSGLLAVILASGVACTVPGVNPVEPAEAAPLTVPAETASTKFGLFSNSVRPAVAAATKKRAVNLGIRFSSKVDAKITALQIYRGKKQTKLKLTGVLWNSSGKRLGKVSFAPAAKGWQSAKLATAVSIKAGQTYVVSYRAKGGQQPLTRGTFAKKYVSGQLTVAKKGGVYRYGKTDKFPKTRTTANYLVDVVAEVQPATSPELPIVGDATLDLPKIAWEGGPEYYRQFANAQDWTDPAFFPIGIWYNGISSDSEAAWDKAHGINYYTGMWEGTDFSLFEKNGLYWVGDKLNDTFDESSQNWPGVFLSDELDGRADPAEGLAEMRELQASLGGKGRFTYANFTQLVIGPHLDLSAQQQYVNIPDVVSLDMYWYTIPFCDWEPYWGTEYADPVPEATCRTASSYGRATNGLTIRDSSDGVLHPRWMIVENLNGLSGQAHVANITAGQLKGAAMSSVINEARGLMWFNQSFTGDCPASSALREAQTKGTAFCGYNQMEAMGEVNNLILKLAPVINTQSYQWNFGSGLDTMLKAYGGYAYVFAMTDGTTGERTFKLPDGISGTEVEVVGEGRTLALSGSSFADSFANEYSYHIYRVRI